MYVYFYILCFFICFISLLLGMVKIHYDINYEGTNDFNNLLDKYNMEMEWDNSCIFYI